MIYLASPFSHPAGHVRAQRYKRNRQATAQLMSTGEVVFSPIVYGYHMEEHLTKAMSHEYWMKVCLPVLTVSRVIYVLTLEGWDQSEGLRTEVILARQLGKSVVGYQTGDFCEDVTGHDIYRVLSQRIKLDEELPTAAPKKEQ